MKDTIVAIATPHGVGGIAVLRLSGEQSLPIATKLTGRTFKDHQAQYAKIMQDDRLIDEVVVTPFLAPHSYTGEDVVEISCHGSLYVQQELLRIIIDNGARLANPGEYTLRAFLNGKMDLAQSEAVADLIDATSEVQHHLAVNQLRGGFSKRLTELRERFVKLTALLELELDFSEEDVTFADRNELYQLVDVLHDEVQQLVDSFALGNALKNGVPVAIVGRPNVGKSTLLNALLNEDRAIVSNIPGTTRDTIEDTFVINGITFRFIDTAGLHHTDDAIESAGIERAYQSVEKAQIILYLTAPEVTDTLTEDLDALAERIDFSQKTLIILHNKCDKQPKEISNDDNIPYQHTSLTISAKHNIALDKLRQCLLDAVAINPDQTMLTNARHHEAMTHILTALENVHDGMVQELPADLLVIDIRDALYYLGQITGEVTTNEVLNNIFSRFCIGK